MGAPNLRAGARYDAGDIPVRIQGEWSVNNLKLGLLGHPPRGHQETRFANVFEYIPSSITVFTVAFDEWLVTHSQSVSQKWNVRNVVVSRQSAFGAYCRLVFGGLFSSS